MKSLALGLAAAMAFALPLHAQDKPADAPAAQPDYVMLKVGGDEIKRSEVEQVWKTIFPNGNPPPLDSLDPKMKENLLRGIASEHVLYKEAEKNDIQDSPEIKEKVAVFQHQAVVQQFLKDKTKDLVSDAKLKETYDDHVKRMGEKDEVHARHILVATKAEAEEVEKKLKKGADFDKLAKEKSQDKVTGASGGDLGWFTQDKMVPEFSKAAFALKKGEISPPVKSDFGWHVIQVTDRRKVAPPAFDKVKDELREQIGNKAVAQYVRETMKENKIVMVDPDGKETNISSSAPLSADAPAADAPAAGSPDDKPAQ